MILNKITDSSAKKAISYIEKSKVVDEHWKQVLVNHVKTCLAIANSDIQGFKSLFNVDTSSRYFAFNPPSIEPSSGISHQLEDDPVNSSIVYIDFLPVVNKIYVHDFQVSIFHLLHEKSKSATLGNNDWVFSKNICNYVYDIYTPYFLNKLENCSSCSDKYLSSLLNSFNSYWQHYVHMLDGFSDLVNYDVVKQKYLVLIDNIESLEDKQKKLLSIKKGNDVLYIRAEETFKMVSQDIDSFLLLSTFPRFDFSIPDVFFRNSKYILKNISEKDIKRLSISVFKNLYISFKMWFQGENGDKIITYDKWKNTINASKSEDKSNFLDFLDLINTILTKRMNFNGDPNFKIEFAALFFWTFLYKNALLENKNDVQKEINLYRETIYSEIENNCEVVSSFIDFCKFINMEELFYLPIENKKMIENILQKEDNSVFEENNGFKI